MDVKSVLATIRDTSGLKRSDALNNLFMKSTDENTKKQIVANDGMLLLIRCLSDPSHINISINACGIMVNCLSESEAKKQVGNLGIPACVAFLEGKLKAGNEKGIEYGSGVFMNIGSNSTFHGVIKQSNAHKVLKKTLDYAQEKGLVRSVSNCLGAISHLCKDKTLKEHFQSKKLLEGFVKMLSSDDAQSRKVASVALWNMGLFDEDTRQSLVTANAVEALLTVLEHPSEDAEILANCATAMAILTTSEKICDVMRKKNQIERVCKLLSSQNEIVPKGISISVWNIALTNEKNIQELTKHQALALLIPTLQSLNQKSDWSSLQQVLSAVLACSQHEKLVQSFKKDPRDGLKSLKSIIQGENGDVQVKSLTDIEQKQCILYALISFIVMTYSEKSPGMMYDNKMFFMVLIELLLSGASNTLFGNVSTSIVKDLKDFKTKYQLPEEGDMGMTVALPDKDNNQVDPTQPKDDVTMLKELINMMGDEEFLERLRPEEKRELIGSLDSAIESLDNDEDDVDGVKDNLVDAAADVLDRMNKENDLRDYIHQNKNNLNNGIPPKDKEKLQDAVEKALKKLDENPTIPEQEQIKKNFDKAIEPILEKKKARDDLKDHVDNAVNMVLADPNTKESDKKQVLKAKDEVDKFVEKKPDADKKDCEKQKEKFDDAVKKIVGPLEDKKDLKDKVEDLKKQLKDPNSKVNKKISPEEKEKLKDKLRDLEQFIQDLANRTPSQVKDKLKDVNKNVDPIVDKCEKRDDLSKKADDIKKRLDDPHDKAVKNLTPNDKDNLEKAVKRANDVANNPKSSKDDLGKEKDKLEKVENDILGKADAKQDLIDKINRAIDDAHQTDKLKPDEVEKVVGKALALKDDLAKHPEYSKKDLDEKKKDFDKTVDPILEKTKEKPLLGVLVDAIKEKVYGGSDSSSSSSSSSSSISTNKGIDALNTATFESEQESKLPPEVAKNLQKQLDNLIGLLDNPEFANKLNDDEKDEIEEQVHAIQDALDGKETTDPEKLGQEIVQKLEPMVERIKEQDKINDHIDELEADMKDLPEKDKAEIEKILDKARDELEKMPPKDELEKIAKNIDDKVLPLIEDAKARKDLADHADKILEDVNDHPNSSKNDVFTVQKAKDDLDKFLEEHPNADKEKCDEEKKKFDDAIASAMKPMENKKELDDKIDQIKDLLHDDDVKLTPEEKKVLEETLKKQDDEVNSPVDLQDRLNDYKEQVKPILDKAEEKKKLKDQIDNLEERLQNPQDNVNNHLAPEEKEKVQKQVDEAKKLLESPNATKDDLEKGGDKLKDNTDDILDKADLRGELVDKLKDKADEQKDAKHLTPEEKRDILDKIEDINNDLKKNPDMDKDELKEKLKELEEATKPLEKKSSKFDPILDIVKDVLSIGSSSSSSSSSGSSISAVEVESADKHDKPAVVSKADVAVDEFVGSELAPENATVSASQNPSIDEEDEDEDVCVVTFKVSKKTGELKPVIKWNNAQDIKFTPEMLQMLTAQLLAGPKKK